MHKNSYILSLKLCNVIIYTLAILLISYSFICHMASPLKLKAQIIMNSNIQSSDRLVESVYREYYRFILTGKKKI